MSDNWAMRTEVKAGSKKPGRSQSRNAKPLKNLSTYLNDHLAGSVTAIKLLAHLAHLHPEFDLPEFAVSLHHEISQDQEELETLMKNLHVEQSGSRKTAGWLAEKLTELKLKLDDPKDRGLAAFEILELLEVGIGGKRSLWLALDAARSSAAGRTAKLRSLNFQKLVRRAEDQHARVSQMRLKLAPQVLNS
jgi:hypothetical protein